ncbi:MAG: hypothetical protein ACYC27_17490 [Armatimonadota bacterium]
MSSGNWNKQSGSKSRKRPGVRDGEIYRDMIDRGIDMEFDNAEFDNARSVKAQFKVYKELQDEEIRDIST